MKALIHINIYIYILFLIVSAIYGYKEYIPTFMLVMQSFIAFVFFICVKASLKIVNIKQQLGWVFFYTLIFSFLLRLIFWEYTDKPFADANDSYAYDGIATKYINEGYLSFSKYGLSSYNIDDFGFFYIIYTVYHFIGDAKVAQYLMLILNSLCITYSSYIVYRLCLMLNIEKKIALAATGFYVFFPFLFVTSAVGLKENVFNLFVSLAFYFMYRYKEKKKIYLLVSALLFVFSTWFFRMAICLMLFVSFGFQLIVNERNKKTILYLVLVGIILAPFVLNAFLLATTGISLEQVLAVTEARGKVVGENPTTKWLVQILSSLFGPFPNFTRTAQYGIYHSSGLLLKSLMNLFFFCGLSVVWKRMDAKIYPIVLYLFMGGMMLVLSGVALDMRYHVTFFSLWIVIVAYAWQYAKPKKMLSVAYVIFTVLLILVYNLR